MPKLNRSRLSRARAFLARLSSLSHGHGHGHGHGHNRRHSKRYDPTHRYEDAKRLSDKQIGISPVSTPSTAEEVWHERQEERSMPMMIRESLRMIPRARTARAMSDMHMDNEAMRKRLAELEMIEMENSSLRLQVNDLQRALEDAVEEQKDGVEAGEIQMADIENSSLRLQVECLREEVQRKYYGSHDVAEKRLRWLNVDAVC